MHEARSEGIAKLEPVMREIIKHWSLWAKTYGHTLGTKYEFQFFNVILEHSSCLVKLLEEAKHHTQFISSYPYRGGFHAEDSLSDMIDCLEDDDLDGFLLLLSSVNDVLWDFRLLCGFQDHRLFSLIKSSK